MSVIGFGLFMGVISVIFYKVRAVTSSEPCHCLYHVTEHDDSKLTICVAANQRHGANDSL